MANSSKLNISELDFDSILLALKTYLQGQSEFTDFDLEGTGISVILRLLAYNTHYLSYYLNMIANEMYLDSADMRESIVSIAKQLGYTPRSKRSATAVVNLTITPPVDSNPSAKLTIDPKVKFKTSVDGKSYTFLTNQAYTVDYDEVNNRYVASNIVLKEGAYFTQKYTVNVAAPERFIIMNDGVDTTSLVVRVQKSSGDSSMTVYTLADDLTEITGTSAVYFLQEVEESKYEVYFGDDILGKALEDGNIVYIDYLTCNGELANYCKIFTPASTIGGYGNIVVSSVSPAFGGADREDKESIRFSAPKNFEVQNRAVTAEDYKTLISRDYPNVDSVAVWCGEDQTPPEYGKVFVSLKPVSGYIITENTKEVIVKQILKRRNVVSIIPEIIDPEYIFVNVDSLVKYDAEMTSFSADAVKAFVISAILNFGQNEVGKFDKIFRYSKLLRAIDSVNPAITNNLTLLTIEKRLTPRLNVTDDYSVSFWNSIVPGTLTSSAFIDTLDPSYVDGDVYYFDDNGLGVVRTYKYIGSVKHYTKTNSGTIDYDTGTISLTRFKPQDIVASSKELSLTVTPVTSDVIPVRNNIIVVEESGITVNMQANSVV